VRRARKGTIAHHGVSGYLRRFRERGKCAIAIERHTLGVFF
jgi:hypothetical protein